MRGRLAVVLALALAPAVGAGEKTHVWYEVHKPAPDVSFSRLTGGTERLKDLRGKVVVLDFWTSWCAPCIEELPALADFYEWTQTRDDVVFVSVNDDSDAGALAKFLARKQPKYPVLLMGRTNPLHVEGYPTKILIDAQGLVRLRHWGGPMPEAELRARTLSLLPH